MVSSASPGGLGGIRVLVVEDDWLLARELRRLLASQGCIVIGPARIPAQALALIARRHPEASPEMGIRKDRRLSKLERDDLA